MSKSVEYPYRALGQKLKAARLRLKLSVSDASGAIEISEEILKNIELGKRRPAEDTLVVLISYLQLKDDDATSIWDLAGYDDKDAVDNIADLNQPIALAMPGDLRVVYTDMVHVMVNDFGVVMNFMQGVGPNSQPLAIARVGMSKEHARSVLDILDKSIKQSDKRSKPKMLEASDKPKSKTDKPNNQT